MGRAMPSRIAVKTMTVSSRRASAGEKRGILPEATHAPIFDGERT
jgi:hypothetical protein